MIISDSQFLMLLSVNFFSSMRKLSYLVGSAHLSIRNPKNEMCVAESAEFFLLLPWQISIDYSQFALDMTGAGGKLSLNKDLDPPFRSQFHNSFRKKLQLWINHSNSDHATSSWRGRLERFNFITYFRRNSNLESSTIFRITQPPAETGTWSALFSNLCKSELEYYLVSGGVGQLFIQHWFFEDPGNFNLVSKKILFDGKSKG